jgi:ABC-type bacteriocin/lantibiotic exporter with double-glycine peptidase domain
VERPFRLEAWSGDRHRRRVAELGRVAGEAFFTAGMVEWSTVLAFSAVQLLVIGGGAYLAVTGDLSARVLVAFTSLVATAAASMFGVSQVIPALIESGAGMQRVRQFLDAEAERRPGAPTERLPRLSRSIRFDDLCFS